MIFFEIAKKTEKVFEHGKVLVFQGILIVYKTE
jgi:hypothetical protein